MEKSVGVTVAPTVVFLISEGVLMNKLKGAVNGG